MKFVDIYKIMRNYGNCYTRELPNEYQLKYLEKKLGYPVKHRKVYEEVSHYDFNGNVNNVEVLEAGYIIERR